MGTFLARAVLQDVSGLTKDQYEMGLVFVAADPVDAADGINAFLAGSWLPGGTPGKLIDFLSPTVDFANPATRYDVYDISAHLDGAPHGAPVFSRPAVLASGARAGSELPGQLAACASYHSAFGALLERGPADPAIPTPELAVDFGAPATHAGQDRLKARRRGRLYFGPLGNTAMGGDGTVSSTLKEMLQRAMQGLTPGAIGTGTPARGVAGAALGWNVWSRRNASVYPVTGGWVANELCTQRGRAENTGRVVWVP